MVLAGAALMGAGLLLHLIEPVSEMECRRRGAGPAECLIRRGFFGVLPYERAEIPSAATLTADDARLGRADPDAVTCTSLAVLDAQGDATPFACVKDAAAVDRARRFFAAGSADPELRIRHSERLVLGISGAFVTAGVLALVAGCYTLLRPRRTPPP